MVILGGMGNVWGVVLGAVAAGVPELPGAVRDRHTFNSVTGTDIDIIGVLALSSSASLIVTFMLFRPEGLLPSRAGAPSCTRATSGGGVADQR